MSLYGAVGEAPRVRGGSRRGIQMLAGSVALDGSGATVVNTPFKTIIAVALSINDADAPGVSTSVLSWAADGAELSIYPWMVTADIDATLIASTGTETVSYIVVGVY